MTGYLIGLWHGIIIAYAAYELGDWQRNRTLKDTPTP